MVNIVNTKDQLENIFWSITTKILGFNPENSLHQDKVRISWPTDGQPAFEIGKDYAYLKVVEVDSPINRLRNVTFTQQDVNNATQKSEYTRVIQVMWTFYGPSSYDRADLVKHSIFLDEYKSLFNANNLYLITDVASPMRIPEQFQGQWWERCDFTASFNEYVKRENTVPYIQSADITIKTDNGLQKNIEISQ
ncbi:MAG: hypothetical protein UT13_C0002G0007 [Candidatus Pacebacteria bacterium GW2011_GWF2_38_9]|nr:MAG: hypothetical protein UT13_C0002G0007 [Candidatus Pacebacteria bacterium GW2011_GWF2_38_9]